MIDLTKKYTIDELASLYAHTNAWEWPTEILGPEPWYWEEARKTDLKKLANCKRFRKLFKKLEKIVPRVLKSRAWWLEILGRTEDDWRTWWHSVGAWCDLE
jgi:hypothetical protein